MKIIKYNIDDFKHIKCMHDFYKLLGILEDFDVLIKSVSQIRMCYTDCDKLLQYILNNVPKSKKKLLRYWDIPYRMDWLNLSPKIDDRLPSGEVHIDVE